MSFMAGLGITSEKAAVVVEFGSRYTRVGFSGETGPRAICRTPENFCRASVDQIGEFLLWLFHIHLQISPRERRLLVVEDINEPRVFREKLVEVALKRIALPGLVFLPRPVASLTATGILSSTGIVAQLGWSGVNITGVIHGVPQIWNQQESTIGGEFLLDEFRKKVDPNKTVTEDFLEDVLSRLCFLRSRAHLLNPPETLKKQDEKTITIDVDSKNVLNVKRSAVRDTVELLVDRRAEDETISTKILDLVLESPIDNRRALAAHIILSGGLAKIKGIRRRVLEQIKEQLKEERFKKLQDLRFSIVDMPCQSNCISWLGGAIYASGESTWRTQIDLANCTLPKEETDERRLAQEIDPSRIPDWCGADLPEPKQKLSSTPSFTTIHNSPIRRMLQISKIPK